MEFFFKTIVNVFNIFQVFFTKEYLCIVLFLFILYLFFSSYTIFFRVLLTILFVVVASIFCALVGGDFFSGFLVTAEMPILLVALLFYFHKFSLQFENLYSFNSSFFKNKKKHLFILFIFLGTLLSYYSNFLFFVENSYIYNLQDLTYVPVRNDFFLWYTFYYVINQIIVINAAIFIFLVSYFVIITFYISKLNKVLSLNLKDNFLFLRKQTFQKQANYSSSLRFYRKK